MLFSNEEKYLKKMQNIAKSTADLHEKIKLKKLMKVEKLNNNRAQEEDQVEAKLKSIMAKFKQAESNVEQIRVTYSRNFTMCLEGEGTRSAVEA